MLISFLIFINLVPSGLSRKTTDKIPINDQDVECGKTMWYDKAKESRIVGGTKAKSESHPWLARIETDRGYCGGTVINDRYVLTAVHCTTSNLEEFEVHLGVHEDFKYRLPRVQSYSVVEIKHKNFTTYRLLSTPDIALLKLDRKIVYTKYIKPICLPRKGENFEEKTVTAVGWGKTSENGKHARFVRQVDLKVLSLFDCLTSDVGNRMAENVNTTLCAYNIGKDTCGGDSGGPLLYKTKSGKSVQVGITSFGGYCGKHPALYTNVSAFHNWILKKTKDATSSSFCFE